MNIIKDLIMLVWADLGSQDWISYEYLYEKEKTIMIIHLAYFTGQPKGKVWGEKSIVKLICY